MVVEGVSLYEALWQWAAISWKVFFAFIPPASYCGGKGCFFISLAFIGIITFIIGEVATILGCVIYLDESVTAITLVALGTSLPDTFASMSAAKSSESADAAIGNVTGSNSVNVFLGLGLPWAFGATYFWVKDGIYYKVPSGPLGFSVLMFLCVAVVCFMILVARRIVVGGELGGPTKSKYISAVLCISLWFIYIALSTMQAYGAIEMPITAKKCTSPFETEEF